MHDPDSPNTSPNTEVGEQLDHRRWLTVEAEPRPFDAPALGPVVLTADVLGEIYRAKQHPTALERQMHYLIGAYDDSLHVLRAEVDRLRDAVNGRSVSACACGGVIATRVDGRQAGDACSSCATPQRPIIGGPPYIGHCEGVTRLEVRDEDGLMCVADGIRVVASLQDDGHTLKLFVRGGD